MNLNIRIVGIPWYEAQTFGQAMALMQDRHLLHERYEDWLAAALAQERQLKAQGFSTVRATIEPIPFAAWCAQHRPGLHINAQARTEFANTVAKNHAMGH